MCEKLHGISQLAHEEISFCICWTRLFRKTKNIFRFEGIKEKLHIPKRYREDTFLVFSMKIYLKISSIKNCSLGVDHDRIVHRCVTDLFEKKSLKRNKEIIIQNIIHDCNVHNIFQESKKTRATAQQELSPRNSVNHAQ